MLTIDPQTNIAQIFVMNGGKHPVFDIRLRICDLECLEQIAPTNGVNIIETCNRTLGIPSLHASHAMVVGQMALEDDSIRRFNIFWSARNGDHVQLLRLITVNGVWQQASRVTRGNEVLHEQLFPGFPPEALGSDWKGEPAEPPPCSPGPPLSCTS